MSNNNNEEIPSKNFQDVEAISDHLLKEKNIETVTDSGIASKDDNAQSDSVTRTDSNTSPGSNLEGNILNDSVSSVSSPDNDEDDDDDSEKDVSDKQQFLNWVQRRFGDLDIDDDDEAASAFTRPNALNLLSGDLTLEGVAKYIQSGKCKHIVFMTGAGISTAAGIPDFRSPGSGLYDTMAAKFGLSNPQSLFEIDSYLANPEPFLYLAKELLNARVKPTASHYFQRLMDSKGLLLRSFTQNIDALEVMAGLPDERVVEAHGSTKGAHCLSCKKAYTQAWFKSAVLADLSPTCTDCNSLVKPDIVFFGENLPRRFFSRISSDLPECDLLIVMGTSLVVQPFASMIDEVGKDCPRLLINREKAGTVTPFMALLGMGGFQFDIPSNNRDVFWGGSCDDGCHQLAELLGWGEELKSLIASEHERLDAHCQETTESASKAQEQVQLPSQTDS